MNLPDPEEFSTGTTMPESEKEMCERALRLFENNDIKQVVEILQTIQLGKPNDLIIRHNIAVAKFRERNTTESADFYQELQKILNESYYEVEEKNESEDYKYPVMVFNFAVVMYHYKQYKKALGVISKLSLNLSSLMNGFAKRVKLLYIDLLLKLQYFDKALIEIEHFEIQLKCQATLGTDTLSSLDTTESESNLIERTSSPDAQESPNNETVNSLEEDRNPTMLKLQQYKTFCSLSLKSMRAAKREYKILFSMLGPSSQNCIISMYLKAYHDYLRGNFKKAAKIISSLPNKDCFELFSKTGDLLDMTYNNNFAACQFYQGKPVVASWYFQKALQDIDSDIITSQKSSLPLHSNSYSGRKHEIYYNFGIALLHAKQATDAFKVLISCVRKGYFKNPRLWLRIAECCIQIAKPENEEGFVWTDEKKKIILDIKKGNDKVDTEKYFTKVRVHKKVESKFTEPPEPTLGYASFCIENALKLIESETVEYWLNVKPGNPLTTIQEIISLQAACYIAGAYIALSLQNYPLLLKRCNELNELPSLPPAYNYLRKQYLAECHFYLKDRKKAQDIYVEEQNQNLSNVGSYDQGNLYCYSPTTESGEEKRESESSESIGTPLKSPIEWFPKEDSAKMAIIHNRALTHVLVKEYDKAADILKGYMNKSGNTFLSPDFLNLAVHVQIKLGNTSKAKSLLKQYSPGVTKSYRLLN